MVNLSIYFLVLGSISGWLLEIIFKTVIIKEKNAQAGMSKGPFCLLYGVGTFFLAVFLAKYSSNILVLFIISLIVLTCLVYITGVLLDKVFNIELWNYSELRFGINKYISLEFMIMWGVLGVIFVVFLFPILTNIYYLFYCPLSILILYVIFSTMIIDYLYTSIRHLGYKV